jgi:hypothetical protein
VDVPLGATAVNGLLIPYVAHMMRRTSEAGHWLLIDASPSNKLHCSSRWPAAQ